MLEDDHGEERYDVAIDIFSPDGRMYQVEYAREAVKKGRIAIGIVYKDGVLLMAEKRVTSRLIEREYLDKVYKIDQYIGCTASGLIADARSLVNSARSIAQQYRFRYGDRIGVRDLARELSDLKQVYTQYGGIRPFGTSLLIGGIDDRGTHLFETDPSGAMKEYKAGATGAGKDLAMPFIDAFYEEKMNLKEAISFGLGGVYKATEGKVDFTAMELATVTKKDGFLKLDFDTFKGYVDEILAELKEEEENTEDGEENTEEQE